MAIGTANAGYIFAQFVLKPECGWRTTTSKIKTAQNITISPPQGKNSPQTTVCIYAEKVGYLKVGKITMNNYYLLVR